MSQYVSILTGKPVDQYDMLEVRNANQVVEPLGRQIAAYELTAEEDYFYWAAKTGNLDFLPPMSESLRLEYMEIFVKNPYTKYEGELNPRRYDNISVVVDPDDELYILVPNIRKPAETREEFNNMYGAWYPQQKRILRSEYKV